MLAEATADNTVRLADYSTDELWEERRRLSAEHEALFRAYLDAEDRFATRRDPWPSERLAAWRGVSDWNGANGARVASVNRELMARLKA